MTELPDLKQLTEEAKESLIVELWEKIQKLKKRLEKKPKKTSWNSSLPPSQGFKVEVKSEEQGSSEKRTGSIGREGGGRQL
jgi:transposase